MSTTPSVPGSPINSAYSVASTQNNAASIAAQITPQQLWQRTIDYFEANTDFWQKFEGGKDRPIMVKTDTSKGEGHTMNIKVGSEFSDEPHYGDESFADETDFEKDLLGEYQLKIGLMKHGVSISEFAEEDNGLRGLLASEHPAKEGRWMGRQKTDGIDLMLRDETGDTNMMIAGGKTRDTLVAANGLSYNLISTAANFLGRLGGSKADLGAQASQAMRYMLVTTADAATVLRQTTEYQNAIQQAAARGKMNPYFTGEIDDLGGISIIDREVIDMDYDGPLGSPMNPRATLSTAITAGTTAFNIVCGAVTSGKKRYTKYFENYSYKRIGQTDYSAPSTTRYVLIINPPTAATDPNKIGMYSYTVNDGIKLTVAGRLGSAASGIRSDTLGSVTWNTGVWSGKHTDVHPVGALVIPCNALGEPIGWSYLLAKAAILRGYGKYRNFLDTSERFEGNFGRKVYVRSYHGQKIRRDRLGRQPGVLKIMHALHYPDLPLPVVV